MKGKANFIKKLAIPSQPEPCDVFIFIITLVPSFSETALKEKFAIALPSSYSLDKSGFGFYGILSLSLFPMVQKNSFIDEAIVLLSLVNLP